MTDRKMNPPIPGHELRYEGRQVEGYRIDGSRVLAGGCRCGAKPPHWPNVSINETKQWHREHKADLRAELRQEN